MDFVGPELGPAGCPPRRSPPTRPVSLDYVHDVDRDVLVGALLSVAFPTGRRPRLASVGLQDGSKMGPTKSDGSALSGQTTGGRPSVVELVRQRLVGHELWDWLGLGGIEGRSHRFGASPRDVPAETLPAPLY